MPRPSVFAASAGGPGKLLNRPVSPLRRSVASFLWILALASALAAQPPAGPGEIVLRAYTLKYQPASEAVTLVYPLLSPKGTVELQPRTNTLVIRDTADALRKIMPVLRGYDHPPRPLRLEVAVVKASRAAVSPQVQHSDLPEGLTKQLHDLLGYDNFETQASAQLSGVEGQRVIYELGPEYRVSFRFGTLDGQRVKLSSFRISRQPEGKMESNLLQMNLTLWMDQMMNLGLAKSEASPDALMVMLTLRSGETARK
jgi:hypothetical protein